MNYNITEIAVTELGYYYESEAKKICDLMDGKTYMNFEVSYSNICGDCTIIIKTRIREKTKEEIKRFFIGFLTRRLLDKVNA